MALCIWSFLAIGIFQVITLVPRKFLSHILSHDSRVMPHQYSMPWFWGNSTCHVTCHVVQGSYLTHIPLHGAVSGVHMSGHSFMSKGKFWPHLNHEYWAMGYLSQSTGCQAFLAHIPSRVFGCSGECPPHPKLFIWIFVCTITYDNIQCQS